MPTPRTAPSSGLHMRYMRLIHLHLRGDTDGNGLSLPVPRGPIVVHDGGFDSDDGGGVGVLSYGSSDGGGGATAALSRRGNLLQLRARVMGLQCRLCRNEINGAVGDDDDDNDEEEAGRGERVYAFTPDEVYRIVESATTVRERLIVVLLLTTGLRIGGLCRLTVGEGGASVMERLLDERFPCWMDVPSRYTTVEKGGKRREIGPLMPSVRVLVAQWIRWERPREGGGSKYLFPAAQKKQAPAPVHMSIRAARDVINRVFDKALIPRDAPHRRPHTFRHTCIQMLRYNGLSFDDISKWIGHSSVSITSGVYGRLRQEDVQSVIAEKVPIMAASGSNSAPHEWQRVARMLRNPYVHGKCERMPREDGP